jgi:ankyrin repeat protein
MENGADVHAKDGMKLNALHLAAYNGHTAILGLLLKNGANVHADNDGNWTALHSAAYKGHEAVLRLLLEHGADIHAKDGTDCTALHWAVLNGHEAALRLLLEHGADVHAKNNKKWTALHLTASNGHETMLRLLVEHGADVHAKDDRDWTALHFAAYNGHETVLRLLLKNGADVHAREQKNLTALYLANSAGHQRAALFLIESGANPLTRSLLQKDTLTKAFTKSEASEVATEKRPARTNDWKLLRERKKHRLGIVKRFREISGLIPTEDNDVVDFPRSFSDIMPDYILPAGLRPSRLCSSCRCIRIGWLLQSSRREQLLFDNFLQLRASAEICDLCRMILPAIEQFDFDVRGINVIISPQLLIIEVLNDQPNSYGFLRLCSYPRKRAINFCGYINLNEY